MTKVSELISGNIGNAISNVQAWGGILFNVKNPAYGAKGDGVTDDTLAVKAALAACKLAGGGNVFFPKGIYYITATLLIPSNMVLSGVGKNVSIIQFAKTITLSGPNFGGGQKGLTNDSASNQYITLKDMSFKANGTAQTGGCPIAFNSVTNLVVDDCMFDSFGNNSLYSQGLVFFSCNTVTISNSNFFNNGGDGLSVADGNTDVVVDNNISFNNHDYGIAVTASCFRVVVNGNDCTSNLQNGIGVDRCTQVAVTGNNCIANGRAGIEMLRFTTANPQYGNGMYNVTGNICVGNNIGITISECTRSIVSGNLVLDSTNKGIQIVGSQAIKVSDNYINGCTSEGLLITAFAGMTAGINRIVDNDITGNAWGIRELNNGGTLNTSLIRGNHAQYNTTNHALISKFQAVFEDVGDGMTEYVSGQTNYDVSLKATSALAGAGAALPATPDGYINIQVAGAGKKIPYYNF